MTHKLVEFCCIVAVLACLLIGVYTLEPDPGPIRGKPTVTFVLVGGMTITKQDEGERFSIMCLRPEDEKIATAEWKGERSAYAKVYSNASNHCFSRVLPSESDCMRVMEGVNYAFTVWTWAKLVKGRPSLHCDNQQPGIQTTQLPPTLGQTAGGKVALFCLRADDPRTCFARAWPSGADCVRAIEGINYAIGVWGNRDRLFAARQNLACIAESQIPPGVNVLTDMDGAARRL